MPTFRYRAYGGQGELAEGSVDAMSQDAAADVLWTQGLTPFQLRRADQPGKAWWQRELFSGGGSPRADLAGFTRELATLNTAEIPLDDALRILADQGMSAGMRTIATTLLADVLNGATLSDAMQKQATMFPAEYVSVVRAGEIGGTMGQVLEELAELLERRMEIRAQVQLALVYPAILVALAVVSLAVIMGVLVPSIAPIFEEGGKPVPDGIRFIVAVQSRWPEILAGILITAAAAAAAAFVALRRPAVRLGFDRCKLKLPAFGRIILQRETARFARTLGTLLKAGVPLLQAATSARAVIGNRQIAAGLDAAIDAVRQGVALNRALQSETALPPIALHMISVGEEAGKLDRMLLRVAAMFEQQTRRSIDKFMTILTPLLTVGIAAIIGGLIMTVMNAVLSMNDLVAR